MISPLFPHGSVLTPIQGVAVGVAVSVGVVIGVDVAVGWLVGVAVGFKVGVGVGVATALDTGVGSIVGSGVTGKTFVGMLGSVGRTVGVASLMCVLCVVLEPLTMTRVQISKAIKARATPPPMTT